MDREQITITAPVDNHKVTFYSYITGREQRAINSALYAQANIEVSDDKPVISNINSKDIITAIQDKMIETLITSIDDSQDNILEKVLDMKGQDYDFVIKALNDVIAGKKKE